MLSMAIICKIVRSFDECVTGGEGRRNVYVALEYVPYVYPPLSQDIKF